MNLRPETVKLSEEYTGKRVFDINHSKIPCDPPQRVVEIKAKIHKWDLIKLFHSKGNHKQNKKKTLRMGENNCK